MDHVVGGPGLKRQYGEAARLPGDRAKGNLPEIRQQRRMIRQPGQVGKMGHLVRKAADEDGEIDLLEHVVKQGQAVDPQKDPALFPDR